jgi:hypothetical protein
VLEIINGDKGINDEESDDAVEGSVNFSKVVVATVREL